MYTLCACVGCWGGGSPSEHELPHFLGALVHFLRACGLLRRGLCVRVVPALRRKRILRFFYFLLCLLGVGVTFLGTGLE